MANNDIIPYEDIYSKIKSGIQCGQFRYGAGLLADWAHHRRA